MNENPNLYDESGREHLTYPDRRGLLEADVLELQLHAPKYDAKLPWAEGGHPIHAFNAMIGSIRACIRDIRAWELIGEESVAYEVTKSPPWGIHNLSRVECLVLAWRRGGVVEHDRIKRLAWPNVSELRHALVTLVRIINVVIPLAAAEQRGYARGAANYVGGIT